ncbi:hypothetical protein [Streptomyces stelliscabiei]|uniref:Ig-like domain-containing protein n=1 Tax=Streptomyces stelliscabiei TaxID=146820 RepID=A0A8I0TUY5_9ACTN|nr:hypothetical protein [Streptomyces stelliscabiei]KND41922.1 hypothetical protein IQ64_26530 [Streptomyces stelliscabiei]MBE1598793.1 hypothetical protein [Streptomyces stelliscabiei]MDX2516418.1 hypothetical protein [Streptomyces stelliscabiei]
MTTRNDRPPTPSGDHEPTQALGSVDEQGATVRLGPVDEVGGTVRLGSVDAHDTTVRLGSAGLGGPVDEGGGTIRLGPVDDQGGTVRLGLADAHDTTVRLDPADGHPPSGEPAYDPAYDDAEYSATVLASHWIQRPQSGDTLVENSPTRPASEPTPVLSPEPQSQSRSLSRSQTRSESEADGEPGSTPPDRVEGTLLRFGPGVTAEVAHRTHRTLPTMQPVQVPRRRRLRRHALPALVVLCVLAFLAWQRLGPSVQVRTVAVAAEPKVLGCDGTADIVGLVRTNGRPGTLSYRWIRSDGTTSGVLREVLVRDQRQARLHLLWTFQGKGRHEGRAELRILSPSQRAVTVPVTYDCP